MNVILICEHHPKRNPTDPTVGLHPMRRSKEGEDEYHGGCQGKGTRGRQYAQNKTQPGPIHDLPNHNRNRTQQLSGKHWSLGHIFFPSFPPSFLPSLSVYSLHYWSACFFRVPQLVANTIPAGYLSSISTTRTTTTRTTKTTTTTPSLTRKHCL